MSLRVFIARHPVFSRILDRLVPSSLFARLHIANKILLGYMTLVALTVLVVAYALLNLQRINNLNRSIVKVDVIVEEAADRMLDALLAQDTYEKRFLILRSSDMQDLFRKRELEFRTWLAALKNLPDREKLPLDELESLYTKYSELFGREVGLVQSNEPGKAYAVSNRELRAVMDRLQAALRTLSSGARESKDRKMKQVSSLAEKALVTTMALFLVSIVAGALAGLVVTHHISSSLGKLKAATGHIADGNFDYDPRIGTQDEIGELSEAFLAMGKRLRKLEEMYLDASPLTRLPGGIAIENVLKKRLDAGLPIAFCVFDLDNFKAFNDRYGYASGSEVIKETARVIENAVRTKGSADDFIGHVGGDDFVVITTPKYMREIATETIKEFDSRIPAYYDADDVKRGYILGKTRQGIEMQFPLMTITIAIVTNELRRLTGPLETSEIAAELKDYAKSIPRSVFVVDKRRAG